MLAGPCDPGAVAAAGAAAAAAAVAAAAVAVAAAAFILPRRAVGALLSAMHLEHAVREAPWGGTFLSKAERAEALMVRTCTPALLWSSRGYWRNRQRDLLVDMLHMLSPSQSLASASAVLQSLTRSGCRRASVGVGRGVRPHGSAVGGTHRHSLQAALV